MYRLTVTTVKTACWVYNPSFIPTRFHIFYFRNIQDKIAARKARREAEARRLADEDAARRILDEQSKSVVTKPSSAENIIIPEVNIPSESTEERVSLCFSYISNI